MQTINAQPRTFNNPGYLLCDLPTDIMDQINKQVDDVIARPGEYAPANHRLAGALKQEYTLRLPDNISRNIVECGRAWSKTFTNQNPKLKLGEIWVNLQRKHEYNPLHDHDGYLSFVIWVRIPYDLKDELALYPQARGNDTSKFGFVYTNVFGQVTTDMLPVDRDWQGRMAMFPSNLTHMVYPFYTSDGLRISISGNLYVDNSI